MSGGNCHIKFKERGIWFEIQCVRDIILSKESKGQDATFERKLLKSWSKYPEWEEAGNPLAPVDTRGKSKSRRVQK